ncbi:C-8 sterol isomerase [Salinomyces thailandicus]|uniref:C-8 sterol isomerase n=1 Tax=Salinomyces thailandicus TaxID=706561 RepID=A0A4U0TJU3_9PEZI|nr:C-8 sterol isomerase [Salinomyces thailandica]
MKTVLSTFQITKICVGILAVAWFTIKKTSRSSASRQVPLIAALWVVIAASLFSLRLSITPDEEIYIFDPTQLHALSLQAIDQHGNDTRAIVTSIVTNLSADPKLANHVNLDEEWIFNNAGGAMGAMYVIHASVTEYLIVFGTAIGTEGHTGRHTADDYFNILHGVQYAYTPGSFEPKIYPQGSVHHLKRGEVKQYSMREACFALEYARGWIPPMLFFGYADTFSSTLDFPTLWATTRVTGREMIGNLWKGKL